MNSFRPFLAATGIALLAGACATPRLAVPDPLPPPASSSQSATGFDQLGGTATQAPLGLQRSATPQIPGEGGSLVAGAQGEPMPPLKGGAVNVNIEGMPVPAFINEFFGAIRYRKFKRPFRRVCRVGGGLASGGLGKDRVCASALRRHVGAQSGRPWPFLTESRPFDRLRTGAGPSAPLRNRRRI